jgi:hypothetical protein
MIRFVFFWNMVFCALATLAVMTGSNILAQEIIDEKHRASNLVIVGLILMAYGLSTLHRSINDLLGFEAGD